MHKTYLTRLSKHIFSGPQIMQIYFNYYLFSSDTAVKEKKSELFC